MGLKDEMEYSEKELKEKYKKFKEKYFFDADLPTVNQIEIKWSNRLTASAGNCDGEKEIKLSTHYCKKYPQDIEDILTHEMIHLIVNGHGKEFKRWMDKIRSRGGTVSRYYRERATKPTYRHVLKCSNCGMTKRYQINASSLKSIRKNPDSWSCGRCGKSGTLTVEPLLKSA